MKNFKINKNFYRITLLVIGLLMVFMSFNHGITGDEDDASAYGKAIISFMGTLGEDTTALHMPKNLDADQILHLYGGAFDMIAAVVHKIIPFVNEFTLRHILNALMGFLAIFFASRIILLFSNYRGATIVALIMFLFPFFLGHSMNNPKDVPFAAAYIMSIYFIIRFWQAYPKAQKKDYIFLILSLALALNIRIAAFLLFAYLGVWMVLSLMPDLKSNLKKVANIKTALIFVGISISAYIIAILFWPFALQDPINNPFIALETFSNLQISLAQTWEGVRVPSAELPWYYVPKSILITSTYVFLLGLILSVFFIIKNRKEKFVWIILFVGFTGFFPLLYIIYKDSNVFHLWRHILFIFPSLAILAAFGWEKLIAFGEEHKSAVLRYGTLIIFALLLLQPAVFIAKNQPNEVNYFNEFAGGPAEAYNNYEFDYYYNGLKPSVDYFIENVAKKIPANDSVVVTTNAFHLLVCYLKDYPNIKLKYHRYNDLNKAEWDYSILHKALVPQPKLKSKSWLPEKHTLFKNEMQGLALSAVIKRPSTEDLQAEKYLKEKNIPAAIASYQRYLAEDPNNTSVQKALANALMQNNQINEAYAAVQKAVQTEPEDLEALQIMGLLSLRKNDPGTAAKIFSQLIASNPNYVAGYFYLGNAQQALGQLNEALSSYNMAARVPQLTQPCYRAMADIYLKMGNNEQAQKLLNLIQGQ